MSKAELKQQAKSLLLKGCYKMAYNKYNRLIEQGSEGFSQREWAIINLNRGICLQFQQRYDEAIDNINRSIEIDPTYEKAYYRKVQILRQLGKYEQALGSIPHWIKNKQIEEISKQIKTEYLNSLGIDQIIDDLLKNKNQKLEFVKQSHSKFYQRLIEQVESHCQQQTIKKIGYKISLYYQTLKENKQADQLESFLSIIHLLLLKKKQSPQSEHIYGSLLQLFWQSFRLKSQPFHSAEHIVSDFKNKEQYKIAKYSPMNSQTLLFLQNLIIRSNIQNQQLFEESIQLISNLCNYPQAKLAQNIFQILSRFIRKLNTQLSHQRLGWLKRSFLLIDAIVRLHITSQPNLTFYVLDIYSLFYLRYYYINKLTQDNQLNNLFQKVKQEQIVNFLRNNLQNFVIIYSFEHFIHRLNLNLLKELIPQIQEEIEQFKELKQIYKTNSKLPKIIDMQKEYELIYTSLLLKIDLKYSSKIDINSLLSHKHNRQTIYDQSLSDISINTLLLLSISNKRNIAQILNHPHSVTNVIQQFMKNSFTQQLQSVNVVTSFIYIVTIDIQLEQEELYAKKMGVTLEQIKKAKQIQKEQGDPQLNSKISQKRHKFREYIAKHWAEIIPSFCSLLLKLKEESCLTKWAKFMCEIAQIDHSRFHNPRVIQVMLECFKFQKEKVGKFFSIFCKKINVQLIKYQYLQSIANILTFNLQNSQHQLIIFQSLLSLINLTSNLSNKIKVSFKILTNCLYEENKYIIHASLQLFNNLLVYEQKQEIDKQLKLKEIVQKYLNFFRDEVASEEQQVPLTDYSHPSRIYSTLLSVAIVMDIDTIQEFKDWQTLEKYLLRIKIARGITLFKVVLYMKMKDKLKGKWWERFGKDIDELKTIDIQKWTKLKQYIK